MAITKKTNSEECLLNIEIPAIELKVATIRIIGDSPLIVHAWSEKAKKEMLDKQMKKASAGRAAKDPWMDYCESMYWLDGMPEKPTPKDIENARFGFPTIAFKSCAVDAGFQQGLIAKKTTARGCFHFLGEFAEIKGDVSMREDTVKIGMGTADLRYRGQFKNWSTELTVRYNPRSMSLEQIVNLLNMGGFSNGVGEWRPSKDGMFGTFHVA